MTCTNDACLKLASFIVEWPGQPCNFCPEHAGQAKSVAEAMGFELSIRPITDPRNAEATDHSLVSNTAPPKGADPALRDSLNRARRRAWMRMLVETVDDFKFVETQSPKDVRLRAHLALVLQTAMEE